MPDEPVAVATPEATPEAETPELENGLLSDAQLAEIFGAPEDETVADLPVEAPKPAEEPKPAEAAEGLDLTALAELDKPETPESQKPAITPENEYFKKVQQVLPNEETLGWAVDALQRQNNAQRAAQSGDLKSLVEAYPFMAPVLQHVVQSYVKTNEQKIIEDFIKRNSPDTADPRIDELTERLSKYENQLLSQSQQQETKRQQDEYSTKVKAIDTEVTALFDKVRFTKNEADRRIVSSLVKVALAEDSKVLNEALSGKLASLRPVFAKAVKDFAATERVKAATVAPAKETTTTPPKPILTGAGAVAIGAAPDVWHKAANFVANVARRKG